MEEKSLLIHHTSYQNSQLNDCASSDDHTTKNIPELFSIPINREQVEQQNITSH